MYLLNITFFCSATAKFGPSPPHCWGL